MNVDDAVRRFRRSVPGPSEELIECILVSATGNRRAFSSRRRRPTGRGVLVVVSVTAAAVAFVTAGLLIRGGEGRDAVPAAPVTPPARVDWGQVATVRLKPDPGISIQEMRERFTAALAFRTHDDDGAGVEVLSARGDEVTVRLPGAGEAAGQAKSFLTFRRLIVLDDESSVIASGPDLRSLEADAKRLTEAGTPLVYYVQMSLQPGLGWSGPERIASRTVAEARLKDIGSSEAVMIAVPADLAVVGGGDGSGVRLIRPDRVVPSSSIRESRTDGDTLDITVDPAHRPDHDRRVRVFADLSEAGDSASDALPGAKATPVGTGTLTTAGDLRIENALTGSSSTAASPDLGGRIEVVQVQSYGARPSEHGEAYTPGDASVTPGLGVSSATTWTRLATAAFDDKEYVLVGATRAGSLVGVGVHALDETTFPSGTWAAGGFGSPTTDPCPRGVGTPRVTSCGPMGSSGQPRDGKVRVTYSNFGRVRPGIERIRVHYQGTVQDAVIDGGWWLVRASADVPEIKDDPMGIQAIGATTRVRITAIDSDGNEFTVPTPPQVM